MGEFSSSHTNSGIEVPANISQDKDKDFAEDEGDVQLPPGTEIDTESEGYVLDDKDDNAPAQGHHGSNDDQMNEDIPIASYSDKDLEVCNCHCAL